MAELRQAWEAADGLEVGGEHLASLWTWDHFSPLSGEPDGAHFEGWTLLAAMAATTSRATVGLLVASIGYRNPDLLADMARTAATRLATLGEALPRIRARLDRLVPPPVQQPLPILVGGGGEKVTLRLVAEHAQLWNGLGEPEVFRHKNAVLDDWCTKVGRDPGEIERTCWVSTAEQVEQVGAFLDAGATHVIYGLGAPFDLAPVERLLTISAG